jgi:hypothetical protein
MVTWDCSWALRMMADKLNINIEVICQILHEDLWNRKICAKFIPHRLIDEQKLQRLIMPRLHPDNHSFLNSISSFISFRMLKTLRKMWSLN